LRSIGLTLVTARRGQSPGHDSLLSPSPALAVRPMDRFGKRPIRHDTSFELFERVARRTWRHEPPVGACSPYDPTGVCRRLSGFRRIRRSGRPRRFRERGGESSYGAREARILIRSTVKIAIVADVHGNLTALEAVIRDIRHIGANLVINGGHLVGSGARPAEVVDVVESLDWPGVIGNAEEVLWRPDPLRAIAERLPEPRAT